MELASRRSSILVAFTGDLFSGDGHATASGPSVHVVACVARSISHASGCCRHCRCWKVAARMYLRSTIRSAASTRLGCPSVAYAPR